MDYDGWFVNGEVVLLFNVEIVFVQFVLCVYGKFYVKKAIL